MGFLPIRGFECSQYAVPVTEFELTFFLKHYFKTDDDTMSHKTMNP